MISVVQNFICTIPERLKILEDNLPKVRDVWGDYQFFVNFNDTINLDEVYSLYQKYISNRINHYVKIKLSKPIFRQVFLTLLILLGNGILILSFL